jgi:hypothetical protein
MTRPATWRSWSDVKLDGATFLLQWAAGGLLFCWVTTRRREVGLGYGWLLRITYGLMAVGAAALFVTSDPSGWELAAGVAAGATVLGAGLALAVSVVRRGAGVGGQRAERERRRARVAAMLAEPPTSEARLDVSGPSGDPHGPDVPEPGSPREFPPALDLVAPVTAAAGLLAAAQFAGGPYVLAAARLLVGAAFLGSVSDAMLLGHWYLVQPGLRRAPLKELVVATAAVWPFEIAVWLWPTGMVQVLNGTVDDGYGGLLGWVWLTCAVSTIALVGVTWLALRERYYSAVMSATGLLYLAILTAFGTDLVARAVLAP